MEFDRRTRKPSSDLRKLDAMAAVIVGSRVSYIIHLRTCRRKFQIWYFGQPPARVESGRYYRGREDVPIPNHLHLTERAVNFIAQGKADGTTARLANDLFATNNTDTCNVFTDDDV